MNQTVLPVGKPQYGTTSKRVNFKIKDGDNKYRILPPVGKFAATGKWAVFERTHWGYRGSDGRLKPFACIEQKRNKMVVKQCPECDNIREHKADYDLAVEKFKQEFVAKGMLADEADKKAKEQCKPLSDWLLSHNRDSKWKMNAMDEAGNIGKLPVPGKAYNAFLARIEAVRKDEHDFDPVGVEGGAWVNFNRQGTFASTVYTVDWVTEKVPVPGMKAMADVRKTAPLTDEQLSKVAREAWDLSEGPTVLTYDQIKRLVDSNGDPEEVDSVFSSPVANQTTAQVEEPDSDDDDTDVPPPTRVNAALNSTAKNIATSDEEFIRQFRT